MRLNNGCTNAAEKASIFYAKVVRFTRIGLFVTFAISVALAIAVPSVIDLLYQLGSIATPALLIPLASSFSQRWRLSPRFALVSIVLSGGISALWLLAGWQTGGVFLGIEAIYPGMAVAVGIWSVGRLMKTPQE